METRPLSGVQTGFLAVGYGKKSRMTWGTIDECVPLSRRVFDYANVRENDERETAWGTSEDEITTSYAFEKRFEMWVSVYTYEYTERGARTDLSSIQAINFFFLMGGGGNLIHMERYIITRRLGILCISLRRWPFSRVWNVSLKLAILNRFLRFVHELCGLQIFRGPWLPFVYTWFEVSPKKKVTYWQIRWARRPMNITKSWNHSIRK